MDDQVLRSVVVPAAEVAVQYSLRTIGVATLGIEGSAGHVRHHGVAAAELVLGRPQGVVSGRGLREPHIATVASEGPLFQSPGDVLLDNDGATGSVDEVRA